MKNALILAMVTQSRNPQVLHGGKIYSLTQEGQKIRRMVAILKIVLLVIFIVFYSFVGQYYAAELFGDSIFVTILLVLVAYVVILAVTYLFGAILLRGKDDMTPYVEPVN